jgi:TIR domain
VSEIISSIKSRSKGNLSLLTQCGQDISYSTRNQDFAERLHADLQDKGVRCWFAPHDIQSGKKIHEQIDEAIRLHDRLLLMLHPSERKSGVRRGPRPCRSTA